MFIVLYSSAEHLYVIRTQNYVHLGFQLPFVTVGLINFLSFRNRSADIFGDTNFAAYECLAGKDV